MLKNLIIIAIVYLVIKYLFEFLGKTKLRTNPQQAQSKHQGNGKVHVKGSPEKEKPFRDGEYIDYEEVD